MLQGYVTQRTLHRRHNRKVKTSMSHRGSATQVAQLGSAVCKYLASLQRCGQGPASRHFGHAGLLIPHGRAPQTCRRSPAGHAGARGGATDLCYIAHILSACVEFTHAAEAALGTQHALKHTSTRPTHRAPHRARHVCSPCACPSGDSPSKLLYQEARSCTSEWFASIANICLHSATVVHICSRRCPRWARR